MGHRRNEPLLGEAAQVPANILAVRVDAPPQFLVRRPYVAPVLGVRALRRQPHQRPRQAGLYVVERQFRQSVVGVSEGLREPRA